MSSVTLKITSLIIRTLSKPIANQLKAQAREHARFRKICIAFAQSLHRVDMRLRLGLLRNTGTTERQSSKEAGDGAERGEDSKGRSKASDKDKDRALTRTRIRPLSEAKAIDSGANFISESFLFAVAGSLIFFEAFRSRRKENSRREDVADRLAELEESEKNARKALVALEKEIIRLRAEEQKATLHSTPRILPKEVWEVDDVDDDGQDQERLGWSKRLKAFFKANAPNQSKPKPEATQPDTSTPAKTINASPQQK